MRCLTVSFRDHLITASLKQDPVKHALSSVEFLGDEETRDWYRSDWTPPGRYGEGAEGVANYFEALAVHAEFLLILEGGDGRG